MYSTLFVFMVISSRGGTFFDVHDAEDGGVMDS